MIQQWDPQPGRQDIAGETFSTMPKSNQKTQGTRNLTGTHKPNGGDPNSSAQPVYNVKQQAVIR